MYHQIFLAILIFSTKANACPTEVGWVPAGDSCYLVSSEKLSWYGAQEFCFGHGGYLAEIKSEKEEGSLHHFLLGKTTLCPFPPPLNQIRVKKDPVL